MKELNQLKNYELGKLIKAASYGDSDANYELGVRYCWGVMELKEI